MDKAGLVLLQGVPWQKKVRKTEKGVLGATDRRSWAAADEAWGGLGGVSETVL